MIETEVEGNPRSVPTAATWVGETLQTEVVAGGDAAMKARRDASANWEGTASQAYRDYHQKVVDAGEEQEDDLKKVAEKLRTYAVKLESIQERMSGRRVEARAGGLQVPGTTILEPPPAVRPDDLPAGSSMLADYAWDHWVPEDVTEAIDEGIRDFGEGVKDVAGDTWDAITPW